MYRKYYSYSDMPQLIKHEGDNPPRAVAKEDIKKDENVTKGENREPSKLFGKFETDDIILAIVILVLILDEDDDSLLLAAIAAIFLSGIL